MNKKLDIKYYGFLLVLLFMFVGSFNKISTIISIFLSLIISLVIGISASKESNISLLKGIITLLMFQNLCIGLGAHLLSNTDSSIKFITQIPFMVISIVFIILLLNKKLLNDKKQRKYFTFYIIFIMLSFLIGRGTIQSILINLRNLITFYFAYSIGRISLKKKADLDSLVSYLLFIGVLFLISGVVLLYGGFDLYEKIGVKEVYLAKGSPLYDNKLDGRFYTTLYKSQVIRMGSLLFEPVNLAYYYSLCFILSLFYPNSKSIQNKILFIILSFLGLFLTYGKGGYMISIALFLMILLVKFLKFFNSKKNIRVLCKRAVIFGLVLLIVFSVLYYKNVGAAANTHFWAIERTWNSIMHRPIGYGLGTGGNMATLFNKSGSKEWLSSGGETALLSFIYQIGLQGGLFLILCMSSLKINLNKVSKINNFMCVMYFMPFVLLGISLLQDNTFTPQCIVAYMFILSGGHLFYNNDTKIANRRYEK